MESDMVRNQGICCFIRFCFPFLGLFSFLLFCLSCSHSPRYDYAAIKAEYKKEKETSGSASPDRTEKSGPSEEKIDATGELNLEKVIRIALQNNPDIHMAVARIQQSEAMLDEAMSVFWPVIGIYGEYLQGNAPSAYLFKTIDQRQLPPNTDFNNPGWFENYEVGIHGRLNLFNGGRDYLHRRMAETGLQISQMDRDSIKNGLVTSVIHAYYSALAAERYVEISGDSVKTVKKEMEMVIVRYEAGSALKSDVLSLKVALAQSQEDLNSRAEQPQPLPFIPGQSPGA